MSCRCSAIGLGWAALERPETESRVPMLRRGCRGVCFGGRLRTLRIQQEL